MKFLVCQRMEVEQPGDWAADGEPVMPNFPTGRQNTFISVTTGKPAYYARVEDHADFSLDVMLKKLVADYPGLPEELLTTYLMETAQTAALLPIGTVLQAYITYDEAKLAVRDSDISYVLWTEQPIPKRYLT